MWLASRLAGDLNDPDAQTRAVRMTQLASLDVAGLPHLAGRLVDPTDAPMAADLIGDVQSGWVTLADDERVRRQLALIAAIETVAGGIDETQTSGPAAIVQSAHRDGLSVSGEDARDLARRAGELVTRLALGRSSGPSVLEDGPPVGPTEPSRMIVRAKPLLLASAERWTREDVEPLDSVTENPTSEPSGPDAVAANPPDADRDRDPAPTQPTPMPEPVTPVMVVRPATPAFDATPEARKEPVAETPPPRIASPMQALADVSVYRMLHVDDGAFADDARRELRARGYDDFTLRMAYLAGSPTVDDRVALVDALTRGGEVDPRPWLRRMLDDDDRRVRLRVISVIATMTASDPRAAEVLRHRLAQEPDPVVAARLRRHLGLR